ncbi:MAG: PEP-CTERM sorting domain-containing protein [Planctomycetales bacterium]|nr:PEP-CTERM sorting domain-containing protein [Planctomycetales bacterium]
MTGKMEYDLMRLWRYLALCAALVAPTANAAYELRVSEIWMGNEPGENLTDDWFEVTNFGDSAWTSADGTLFFDDDSADATAADALFGVDAIGPGESVVFVDGNAGVGGLNLALWHSVWDPALSSAGRAVPQVGSYEGSGLGQGGDGVALFLDVDGGDVAPEDLLGTWTYPDSNANGGQSYDPLLHVFSLEIATDLNDMGQPAIGTPGWSSVPEPASLLLAIAGLSAVARRRR